MRLNRMFITSPSILRTKFAISPSSSISSFFLLLALLCNWRTFLFLFAASSLVLRPLIWIVKSSLVAVRLSRHSANSTAAHRSPPLPPPAAPGAAASSSCRNVESTFFTVFASSPRTLLCGWPSEKSKHFQYKNPNIFSTKIQTFSTQNQHLYQSPRSVRGALPSQGRLRIAQTSPWGPSQWRPRGNSWPTVRPISRCGTVALARPAIMTEVYQSPACIYKDRARLHAPAYCCTFLAPQPELSCPSLSRWVCPAAFCYKFTIFQQEIIIFE